MVLGSKIRPRFNQFQLNIFLFYFYINSNIKCFWYSIFFFCGGRSLNPKPCIFYALSLPIELSSRGLLIFIFYATKNSTHIYFLFNTLHWLPYISINICSLFHLILLKLQFHINQMCNIFALPPCNWKVRKS